MSLLKVEAIDVKYGKVQVLWGVSFTVNRGECVAIIGPNGAGKTTTLKTVVGLLTPISGKIEFNNERIDGLPAHEIVKRGVTLVPEGGRVFPRMSVIENLELGALTEEAKSKKDDTLEFVFQLFPILKERKNQLAGTLSGGEQRMLSIGRGLMSLPKLIMLDELSLGLAPTLVQELYGALNQIKEEGVTVLLVEQYVKRALEFAERGYLMETGKIVLSGKASALLKDEYIVKTYL